MTVQRILSLTFALACSSESLHAQSALHVTGLPEDAPLTVAASATERVLLIDLALESEWHAYARDVGNGQPVRIALADEVDFAATGALVTPNDDEGQLSGKVRLRLPIEPGGDGRELRATFDLQVCDALECLAPMSLTISGKVETVSALLVVAKKDERAGRIADWMRQRGFDVTVDTYGEVSLETCDASDVVVADSNLFRKDGIPAEVVRGFPRTSAPIVAVGFLGTQLVEAHGIAMTSGYI